MYCQIGTLFLFVNNIWLSVAQIVNNKELGSFHFNIRVCIGVDNRNIDVYCF